MPFEDGEVIGPYKIVEQLGRGGMANVYKAYHANLDRHVALKVLHPNFLEDPNFLARFEREAKVVARLEHPNIIPVYDYSKFENRPYLVMKYVEGYTLKSWVRAKGMNPEEGIRIIEAIGSGLSYAHKKGIFHRDIKPSNVMITEDGEVFLADFGLARIASAGETTISADVMIGTPQYISPEQARGDVDLDERADIYSFGILVYELVVGKVPFTSATPLSIVHAHMYTPLPLPSDMNRNVPHSVEQVLLKALAKEKDDRYESVDDFVAAFKHAVRGKPLPPDWIGTPQDVQPTAVPTPSPSRVQAAEALTMAEPGIKKKRRGGWKRIIFLLLLSAGIYFGMPLLRALRSQSPPPVQPPAATAQASETVQVQSAPTQAAEPTAAEQMLSPLDIALQEALARVAGEPDNPLGYLDLAAAFIDLDRQDEAGDAFEQGRGLTADVPGYFVAAGDLLATRGLWLPALENYIQALHNGYNRAADAYFDIKFRQAMYRAPENENSRKLFFETLENTPDEEPAAKTLLLISQARYTLIHEQPEAALTVIDQILAQGSVPAEARLVRAEALAALGEKEQALGILAELINADIASWIKVQARNLTNQISN